jgi:Uma2 family endonuclease
MAYEEYDDDVLELDHEIDTSKEEDDEMPTIIHGLLQLAFINIISKLLIHGVKAVPPITFRGVSQKYIPDVSIYEIRTLSSFAHSEETAPPPLWAIEIISPGQTIRDMIKKCEGMIASGVEECWIVEPANESITICTKERRFVRHEGEVLTNRFMQEPLRVEAIFREEL